VKIVVIGGTGLIGGKLVAKLAANPASAAGSGVGDQGAHRVAASVTRPDRSNRTRVGAQAENSSIGSNPMSSSNAFRSRNPRTRVEPNSVA
jgi:uncharacterized protein YbjT (DUF2867 family)